MKYIGCDGHISSCTFCVLDEKGSMMDNRTVVTNGAMLVSYLRTISGEKKIAIEETGLARWLHSLFTPEVEECIVCDPLKNRLLGHGAKTDDIDAYKLADLLRGGFLKSVFHQGDSREELRDLMHGYESLIKDFVRLKNRYKALFRNEGIRKTGESFYKDESFLKDLKSHHKHFVAQKVYELIHVLEQKRIEYVKEITRQSRKYPEITYIKSIPGLGVIQASKIVAIVVSPYRFKNKYKFHAYSGLVKHPRRSGDQAYGMKKIHGNSTLKGVYRMAGKTVLQGTSGLRKAYDRLLVKGMSHEVAYNAICRKIASLSLSVWKKQEGYKDDYDAIKRKKQKVQS